MAEFCLDCWNKINDTHLTKMDVVLSKNFDLCEECAEFKQVIVKYKKNNLFKELLKNIKDRKK